MKCDLCGRPARHYLTHNFGNVQIITHVKCYRTLLLKGSK